MKEGSPSLYWWFHVRRPSDAAGLGYAEPCLSLCAASSLTSRGQNRQTECKNTATTTATAAISTSTTAVTVPTATVSAIRITQASRGESILPKSTV